MPSSGSYARTTTRDTIIRLALLAIGKLGQTESPNAQVTTDCAAMLNMMTGQWMGKQDFAPGLKMWTRQRADLFLSNSQYVYSLGPSGDNWAGGIAVTQPNQRLYGQNQLTAVTLAAGVTLAFGVGNVSDFTANDYLVVQLDSGDTWATRVTSIDIALGTVTVPALPSQASTGNYVWNYTTKGQRPLELVTCLLRDINSNDTPIDYMTLPTYEALPTKTMPGYVSDPTSVYYEPQLTNGNLYLDVAGAQDVTKHLHVVYLRPVQSFLNPLDEPDYSIEWQLPLCLGLGKLAAPMYNKQWTDLMESNYTNALAMAREANPETSEAFFQVYDRNPYGA